MYFFPTLSADELQRYHRAVTRSSEVRNHFDMLEWLQGDIQRYLPHDILIAAWGDFEQGPILHDIISPLAGVRSRSSNAQTVSPMMRELFARWNALGKRSFALHVGDGSFLLDQALLEHELGSALKRMRYATVHGIVDERGSHDCLYVSFSATTRLGKEEPGAMAAMLPAHLENQFAVQRRLSPAWLLCSVPVRSICPPKAGALQNNPSARPCSR